jgi:ubiquinone/menaquinone biosynthesis C-methylase UbiE
VADEQQFERVARLEDDHWWFAALRDSVRSALARRIPPSARVLDAGCGTGHVIAALPDAYERVAVDSNPAVLALARDRRPGIEFVEGSVESLPFPDASFDAVISLDVISDARVESPDQALRELRRVLREGGLLLLNLPAYEWLRGSHDEIAQTGRRYTARRVTRMLRDAGFGRVRAGYRVSVLFPVAALRRLRARGTHSTDVVEMPRLLNSILLAVSRADGRLASRIRLPFGLSVWAMATATRPAQRPRLRERLLAVRPLVGLVQFAVTGERVPRRHRLLAEEIAAGPNEFVLDLGCGAAPMLEFVKPRRYAGLDEHRPSLEVATRRFSRPGYEFLGTGVDEADLSRWRGADVVVASSMTHHLTDEEVVSLIERVFRDVAPDRMLVQDAEATGPLGPLVTALDEGAHLRSPAELIALIRSRGYAVRSLWSYRNPLRSFHQFLLEVRLPA